MVVDPGPEVDRVRSGYRVGTRGRVRVGVRVTILLRFQTGSIHYWSGQMSPSARIYRNEEITMKIEDMMNLRQ